ncbi:nuclear envelope pore membrane protein POM 121 isoform X2 [Zootoca vivipara]|uniref:nuclear envelope pore membrane protein POM 121 isoform X2 n=1 Tax=Zootoca vivipara TaxID=8524 RepID=UPI00293BE02C|nr:nuclear envelope pore membrane protein POM 121 isoform X2 [Zootoca vivipara]
MSRGGGASGPGWGWWPPSRRRNPREREQQQQRGRRRGGGSSEGGRAWAFPAAAAAAAAASLSLLVLLLGLSGAALSLAVAAAAGGVWAASSSSAGGGGFGKEMKGPPSLPHRAFSPAVANGGPAMGGGCCYASPASVLPERKRRQQQQQHQRGCCGDHLSASPHFMLSPRRRYPIQQAQYSSLGTLPSICWDGYRRKNRLSIHNSSLTRSPVMVKIARPDSSLCRSPLLEQLASPVAFSATPNSTLDPCAKETVLSALRESRKRAVEEEEEGEEDQNVPGGQESKRRRHDSSGSGQSAFEPLVANGAPASLVPKPGSLKRCLLLSHCLEEGSSKRSRTSSLSSINSLPAGGIPSSIRNAIASSYSSTRGLSQLWKRSGPSTSPLSSPASSRSQTPERPNKKARYPNASLTDDESHQSINSTPVRTDKEVPAEKSELEMPLQSRHSSPASPPSSGSTGKRKRKIQLLSTRREDNFTMPLPPQLGYSVTSADLDAEKAAALQWFNRVLEDKTDSTPSLSVPMTSPTSTLSFGTIPNKSTAVSLAVTAASTNPLLESLKKMQDGQNSSGQAGAGSAAETPPLSAPSPSLDLGSSMPMSSPEVAKAPLLSLGVPAPLATTALSPSSSAAQPASSTCSPMAASSSELGQTPARPASAAKPSTLFGILTSPPAAPVPTTTTASPAPEAAPMFKPVFGSLVKSEGLGFSMNSTTTTGPAPVTGTLPSSLATPPVTSSSTFKPVFGAPPPPATSALSATVAAASPFTFQATPMPTLPASSSTTTATPGFPIPLEATVTTTAAALLSTTANATAVSSSKAVFGFGSTMPASTATPSNTSATAPGSSQHPSLFGAPSTSSPAPLFQFSKLVAPTGPTLSPLVSSAFSQAPSCNTEAAPSTTTTTAGFSLFGNSSATTAPLATTQPPLTFGSGASAFTGGFGTASKPPPPYPTDTSQLALDTTVADSQQAATKPSAGPVSFGANFNFSQPAAQPAFGSTSQTPFGGPGPLPSFGAKSTTQPAFGATTSVFSFGTPTTSVTSGFGSNTQTTSSNSSAGSSVFGSSAPTPFSFGAANQPPGAVNAFGMGAAAAAAAGTAGSGAAPVGFSFGSGQSGGAGAAATPFGSSLAQNPLGAQSQSSGFAFSIPGTQENKPAFGGAPPPTFGQSSPAPGAGTVGGSTLSFGTSITPTFGSAGPPFGPPAPTFSIGAGSKTGSRQRLQARRQHTRKK